MTEDGWIPVDRATLKTKYPGVYAIGDVNSVGTPKAGVFSEGAGRVVAEVLIAEFRGEAAPGAYSGAGACYIEWGDGDVGRVDVDFLSGPRPTGAFLGASPALVAEKSEFGASRRRRWFGLS
jgi:sulfide:quinone oxidoreductase